MFETQPPHDARPTHGQSNMVSTSKTHDSANNRNMSNLQSETIDDTAARSNQANIMQMPHHAHLSRCADPSEEDIDDDPQAHFLSPVQMYEAWDDSDDEDGEDVVEWDAGIFDFSLFHSDHKHAKDNNMAMPTKWNDFLSDQAKAYERVASQDATEPDFLSRTSSGESLPGLTPDCSPQLQDNMEYDSDHDDDNKARPQFCLIVTPPPEDCTSAIDDDEDDMPLSFFVERGRAHRRAIESARSKTLFSRPGLRGERTLSGKRHAWRRPYWDLWTIKEGEE